jgi:formylmethanofuran dehydrogenase subunit E
MKFMDYGKMAVTLLNLRTGRAVRVLAREEARQRAKERFPQVEGISADQVEAYRIMTDAELFEVMEVRVAIRPEDMPGRPVGECNVAGAENMCRTEGKC